MHVVATKLARLLGAKVVLHCIVSVSMLTNGVIFGHKESVFLIRKVEWFTLT